VNDIIADTNLLLRIIADNDPKQRPLALAAMASAHSVAVTLPALCEIVWVMERSYRIAKPDVAAAIRFIANMSNVALNRPALEAGLRMLDAGGDFADGVIAFDGQWLGGETFVSFDKKAVKLLQEQGCEAVLLG
jgi:predicted nucleic-acid-binding protein